MIRFSRQQTRTCYPPLAMSELMLLHPRQTFGDQGLLLFELLKIQYFVRFRVHFELSVGDGGLRDSFRRSRLNVGYMVHCVFKALLRGLQAIRV